MLKFHIMNSQKKFNLLGMLQGRIILYFVLKSDKPKINHHASSK
jgi:hypothetical protein